MVQFILQSPSAPAAMKRNTVLQNIALSVNLIGHIFQKLTCVYGYTHLMVLLHQRR